MLALLILLNLVLTCNSQLNFQISLNLTPNNSEENSEDIQDFEYEEYTDYFAFYEDSQKCNQTHLRNMEETIGECVTIHEKELIKLTEQRNINRGRLCSAVRKMVRKLTKAKKCRKFVS